MKMLTASAYAGVRQIPRDHENMSMKVCLCPYSEPTLVTLAEKAKACRDTPVQGTRQIRGVS